MNVAWSQAVFVKHFVNYERDMSQHQRSTCLSFYLQGKKKLFSHSILLHIHPVKFKSSITRKQYYIYLYILLYISFTLIILFNCLFDQRRLVISSAYLARRNSWAALAISVHSQLLRSYDFLYRLTPLLPATFPIKIC